jgi:translocation and assembly module TamB
VTLRQIVLNADLSPSGIDIKTLTARDGEKGTLDGKGHVDFADNAKTNATLTLNNFHLLKSDKAEGFASAALNVTGKNSGYQIGGTVDLGEFNITVPEQFQTNIPQLNIIEPDAEQKDSELLQSIDLVLAVHAPGRVFVRGWGLDAEFGGDLEVSGTLAAPQVNGAFESIRGRYEEFGKRFALDQAKLRFQGAVPPSPYLDIKATTTAGDVQASVLLTGPVAKPGIAFASVPALPEDEVMSRILFGKTMSGITPFQAIQLTQTLQRFSGNGGGGFDPLGTLRSATGLDDIRVDSEEGGETSVGVGKYLTEKVYLEVEKGAGATSGAATIQIELTPSIKVDSKIGQDAQGGAGIFWSRDY